MRYQIEDAVLHIIYEEKDRTSGAYRWVIEMADQYEGPVANRMGANFPLSTKNIPHIPIEMKKIQYVIMYRRGDAQTKKHELCHARYFLDPAYRQQAQQLWNSLEKKSRQKVETMLQKMRYPSHVFVDEFQAYYFTEKENFFGKLSFV